MRGTPMSLLSYVAGIVGSVIINVALITILVVSIGMAGFNLHFPYHSGAAAITILIGVLTFSALGLAVTALVPNGEAAPAVINGTAFPIVFISGVFYPINNSSILAKIADFFPVRHLVKGLVGAFETGPGSGFQAGDILIMLVWAAGAFAFALWKFRWEPRHR
jgi:ABC-2 type transport system permease protein